LSVLLNALLSLGDVLWLLYHPIDLTEYWAALPDIPMKTGLAPTTGVVIVADAVDISSAYDEVKTIR